MKGNVRLLTALCLVTLSLGCGLRAGGLEIPGDVTSTGGAGEETGGTGGDPGGTGGGGSDPGLPDAGFDPGTGGAPSDPGQPDAGSDPGTGGAPADGGVAGVDAGTGGQPGPVDALPPDAGVDPVSETPDAAPPVVITAGTIQCGSIRCDVDTQLCCMGAAGAATCARKDVGCALATTPRACDGPEDCDGERVCCANGQVLVGAFRSACLKPSECANNGGAPLCRGRADCFGMYKTCEPTSFAGTDVSTCTH